jgi:hypothetical protein
LHEQKAEVQNFNRNAVDWKSEIKKNFLLLSAYQTIISQMSDTKDIGNTHFRDAVKMPSGKEKEQEEHF